MKLSDPAAIHQEDVHLGNLFVNSNGWSITEWTPPKQGPLPTNLFTVGGPLLIGVASEESLHCNLAWLNESLHWCSIAELPYLSPGQASAPDIKVGYGAETIPCHVELFLTDSGIRGEITPIGDFGGEDTGTFIATAHPQLPPACEE